MTLKFSWMRHCDVAYCSTFRKKSLMLYLKFQAAIGILGLSEPTDENTENFRYFEKYSPKDTESYPRITPESHDNQFLLSRHHRYSKCNNTKICKCIRPSTVRNFISHILRWSRGKRAGLWYPSSRVQTRPKPSDFSGEKNPQHAFLRRGSKAVGPTS